MTVYERNNFDETLKLKLCISRDVHTEFMRKVLGKVHHDTVFGESCAPSIYSSSSRDSAHSHELLSPTARATVLDKEPGSPTNCSSMMSILEFCVLCDNHPSPIPGSPNKRRNTIPPANSSDKKVEIARKFTFSSLLTELNEYPMHGISTDLNAHTRSTLGSPVKLDQTQIPVPSIGSQRPSQKELLDWMVKLETSRNVSDEVVSLHSQSHNQLLLNIASASTRLDETSFQGMVDQSMSSSLSTPTITAESPNLSRSTSNDNLQQLAAAENASNNAESVQTDPIVRGAVGPNQSQPYPFTQIGSRQPIVAKRNPKIEKMISDAQSRSNSPNSLRMSGSLSRSMSTSHSHSFYDNSAVVSGMYHHNSASLQSASLIHEGIAGNESKYVLNNPHAKTKPKPFYALFPNGKKTALSVNTQVSTTIKPCSSSDTVHSVPRLSTQEMINNRKVMARKMREFCINQKIGTNL